MQNFVQLEVPGMKSDAAEGKGKERSHVGFLTWGMIQGHFRDCANVFSIYGFKPVPRIDAGDFEQKVYSQYAEMYKLVVESPDADNEKQAGDIWKKWINATYLNGHLYEDPDEDDDEDGTTTGMSIQRKDLQKFYASQRQIYNIKPQCKPSSMALLLQLHYAKLLERVLNVKPDDRGMEPDKLLTKSPLMCIVSGAAVGKRDANPKFAGGNSLSQMDRNEGVYEPRSFLSTSLVVFRRNY